MSAPSLDSESSQSSSGYEDGLGRRVLAFDRESGDMLERLVLRPELSAFETALNERVATVAGLEDERFTRPRAVERGADDRLTVVSEHVTGRRLADVLDAAAEHGIVAGLDAGLGLLLELLPALARLHDAGLAHGALAPGRVMITPAGQVVLLDSIYADPLERLKLTRKRLWSEFRLAFPSSAGVARFDKAADLGHATMVAVALSVGRPLRDDDYPEGIPALRQEILEIASIRGSKTFAEAVDKFFGGSLPLAGRRAAGATSADEAAIDLRKLVRKELGINACRTALLEFFQQVDAADVERTAAETAQQPDRARAETARLEAQPAGDAERLEAERAAHERTQAERSAQGRAEAERVARERAEAERIERERAEQARAEAERIERERAEKARAEAERVAKLERERAEAARLETERVEGERAEKARLEAERLERERVEKARLEAERIEKAQLEAARLEKERAQARHEAERIEKARLEAERLERERIAQERAEQARLEAERLERERIEKARLEAARLEKERAEKARLEAERLERERREAERLEKARLEAERLEKERIAQERAEQARLDAERLERERVEKARLEAERIERERAEKARLEAERLERERIEKARLEAERLERERTEKARLEAERLERERAEKARLEAERVERERLENERRERVARERAEKARLEAERAEKARAEAERLQNEHAEAERRERELLGAARAERERAEKARAEADRLERERVEHARLEAQREEEEEAHEQAERARIEAERVAAERIAAEHRDREFEREFEKELALEEEVKRERELEREREQELARERELQGELVRERELAREQGLEQERARERQREREQALEQERAREREHQRELELERDRGIAAKAAEKAKPKRDEPAPTGGWLVPPDRAVKFEQPIHDLPPLVAPAARVYPIYVPPAEPSSWTADPSSSPVKPEVEPVASARPSHAATSFQAPAGGGIRLKEDVNTGSMSTRARAESRTEPENLSAEGAYEPFGTIEEPRAIPWKLIAAGAVLIAATVGIMKGYTSSTAAPGIGTVRPVEQPATAPAAPPPAPPVAGNIGRLVITTQPAGAKVTIDGKPAGESPLTIDTLKPGRHTILLAGASGATAKRTVRVDAGQTVTLDVPLFSGFAAITAPFPIEVSEGGKSLGTSEEQILLSPGSHSLRLANKDLGYVGTETVEIQPGEVTKLALDPRGRANINAAPWAEVWIDGEKAGETPLANVAIRLGIREIVFKNPQFGERKVTTTITGNAPATISIDFNK